MIPTLNPRQIRGVRPGVKRFIVLFTHRCVLSAVFFVYGSRAPGLLILVIIIYKVIMGRIYWWKRGVSCQGGSTLTEGQWGFVSLSHCQKWPVFLEAASSKGNLFSRLIDPFLKLFRRQVHLRLLDAIKLHRIGARLLR